MNILSHATGISELNHRSKVPKKVQKFNLELNTKNDYGSAWMELYHEWREPGT
jgi:hypothetical protein